MKWIELTLSSSGKTIFLNSDLIQGFCREDTNAATEIFEAGTNETIWLVVETPAEILAQCVEAV